MKVDFTPSGRLFITMLLLGIWLFSPLSAQVPTTELYLFQLEKKHDSGEWIMHSPMLLSGFNSGGYTNQPEFIDDQLLYVSVRLKDSTQNDIYALSISDQILTRVTATAMNEFSPLLHPDGLTFSCVRQEEGDAPDQRVFRYPLDRSQNGEPYLDDLTNIGYHCWLNNDSLALFLTDDPPTLALRGKNDITTRKFASNIGRCLKLLPNGDLAYVHKYTEEYWYLKRLDLNSLRSEIITQMPGRAEDFTVDRQGNIFTGSGGKLYVLRAQENDTWVEIADLALYGISHITRLALNSSGLIAIVNSISE